MNTVEKSGPIPVSPSASTPSLKLSGSTIGAGIVAWLLISLGFLGLKILMQERPEFAGQPVTAAKVEMVQDAPLIVMRKVGEDVSVVKPMQPEQSDIRFDLAGRRDYRGLRTIVDMSGEFHGHYLLTNSFEEPLFVLFKCPHPRVANESGGNLPAGGLKLQSSVTGVQENASDAWFWSGNLAPHSTAGIDVSYQAASLKGVSYRVGEQNGNPVKPLQVTFHRQDLPLMRFESGDGAKSSPDDTIVINRRDFLAPDFFSAGIVESRSLYTSLTQLLEIGPGICLLFLLTVSAMILARQELTPVQMLTIAIAYALYFPLILYLSTRFSFAVALIIAAAVPGVLLANYARWLLGRFGWFVAPLALALFWVFPTLAAFAGWNRGMVLLCLGVVTLAVLINLQNQSLRRRAVVAALAMLLLVPLHANATEVQVTLPAELVSKPAEAKHVSTSPVIAFDPVQYTISHEAGYFRVEAQASFKSFRGGDIPAPLFVAPVYLLESRVESSDTNQLAAIVNVTNSLKLLVENPGQARVRIAYRVPIENRAGRWHAEIPLLTGLPGNAELQTTRPTTEILTGHVWSRHAGEKSTAYDIGVAGEDALVIEWSDQPLKPAAVAIATNQSPASTRNFYGIGLTRAQNLTVINSDGSCTGFAEFEVPAFQSDEFKMKLPTQARLISASINGNEIGSPTVEDQVCRVKLPGHDSPQTACRLSFRIAYPAVQLGFIGTTELVLPEVFQTAGTMEWAVALPNGYQTQVVSSGLELQKTAPDLGRFGDYGRILQSHAHTYLAKDLAPPGPVALTLKYRQSLPGIYESR